MTARALRSMNVPYRIVVEEQEWSDYRAHEDARNLLVLDRKYQREYQDLRFLLGGSEVATHTQSKGSGPARNFIWEHSISEGHSHHWIMDDNIRRFGRLHGNKRTTVETRAFFFAMEQFALRYQNLALCGPNYEMFSFCARQETLPAYVQNTRLFSCILIRNDIPFRWRGRYNERHDPVARCAQGGLVHSPVRDLLSNEDDYADGQGRQRGYLRQGHAR